jgi:acetolactate synthase-1/2/3 large subunit
VLVGDAAIVRGQMLDAVGSKPSGRHAAAAARAADLRRAHGYFNAPAYTADDAPLLPQRVIGEMMRTLPVEAIVTCDAGENRILMTNFYQTKQAGGFLQAAGSGPMALPSPLRWAPSWFTLIGRWWRCAATAALP